MVLTRVATVIHQRCQEDAYFLQKSLTTETIAALCLWRTLSSCSSVTESATTAKKIEIDTVTDIEFICFVMLSSSSAV